MEYTVDAAFHGKTVKEFVYTRVGVSRSVLTSLKKKENGILLNGVKVTVRALLRENDRLTLAIDDDGDERTEKILPVRLPLAIVYEDDQLLVANKPSDMPTHPTRGHYEDTLANAVTYYMQEKGSKNFVFRAVNRLDRDTSGLVLMAKNQLACAKLSELLQSGGIEKTYLALLCGNLTRDEGRIEKPIRRTEKSIITRECCEQGQGAYALTHYRVLARYDGYTLVCARPITGRTHQLRVHFANIGHPILGDTLYGSADPAMERQALHAVMLRFTHPYTGEEMKIAAMPPRDMLKHLKEFNLEEILAVDKA